MMAGTATTEVTLSLFEIIPPIITAIGVFIAAIGIFLSTDSAKKRATIDLIMKERNDADLRESIKVVNNLAKDPQCVMSRYIDDEATKQHIIHVLNQREFVSAGIHSKAFHEKLYKDFQYSMFMRDWNNLHGFIQELRKRQKINTLFQEFELLAKKWQKQTLKSKS